MPLPSIIPLEEEANSTGGGGPGGAPAGGGPRKASWRDNPFNAKGPQVEVVRIVRLGTGARAGGGGRFRSGYLPNIPVPIPGSPATRRFKGTALGRISNWNPKVLRIEL